eukprot:jgi/Undpi1/6949/HiC_scaffold_21.g09423.m1
MSRSVFTFYVASTITLDHLTLTLDVINENRISDGFIGTTGSIGIDRAADGSSKWWNVSTGGTLQTIIELATPALPSPMYPNNAVRASAQVVNAPTYEGHPIEAPPAYRPPPVAPGVAPTASAKYDKASNYNNSATNNNSNNNNNGGGYAAASYGDGSSLPQARAVPVYEGSPADDPYNARGALVSSAARPRAGAAGAGTTSSAPLAAVAVTSGGGGYPSATPTAPAPLYPSFGSPPVQQPYGGRQSQRHSTNYQGSYGVGNNNS